MYCEQRQRNGFTILECFGRFDSEDSNQFIQALEHLQGQGSKHIVLNLSPIYYLDPKAVHLLRYAQDFFHGHGGTVSVVSPLSAVRNELVRGNIPEDISTFETLYDALHRPHAAYGHTSLDQEEMNPFLSCSLD